MSIEDMEIKVKEIIAYRTMEIDCEEALHKMLKTIDIPKDKIINESKYIVESKKYYVKFIWYKNGDRSFKSIEADTIQEMEDKIIEQILNWEQYKY